MTNVKEVLNSSVSH